MHVTACDCAGPGWCERHQCLKTRHWFESCRRSTALFAAWEQGQGPGQDLAGYRPALSRPSCTHLGPMVRDERCPSCRGSVRLKVFRCAHFGECTLQTPLEGIPCCAPCPLYVPLLASAGTRTPSDPSPQPLDS